MEEQEYFGLKQLNGFIKDVLEGNFVEELWVIAEIAELRRAGSGHVYMELIEKKGDKVVARMRANLWSFLAGRLLPKFSQEVGEELKMGMKVLFRVGVSFHEVFGISLVIKDVDPSYTLGDLAAKRAHVIKKLAANGLLDLNAKLEFPLVPQTIAVISSSGAAGWGDFLQQLNLARTYALNVDLFEATMQGDQTGASVVGALERILRSNKTYDLVCIIRGGGAKMDLQAFDEFDISAAVAQYPLPVITGIGHERDESVLDLVAYQAFKTPTAVAQFIVQQFEEVDQHLNELKMALLNLVKSKTMSKSLLHQKLSARLLSIQGMISEKLVVQLSVLSSRLEHRPKDLLAEKLVKLSQFKKDFEHQVVQRLRLEEAVVMQLKTRALKGVELSLIKRSLLLNNYQKQLNLLDPKRVLKRGYALIKGESGKVLTGTDDLSKNERINVELRDGSVVAKVLEKRKNNG